MNNEKGIALLTVLIVLVVISIMGMSLMRLGITNIKMSSNDRDFQSTYYIAESGATYMMNMADRNILEVYKSAGTANDLFTLFENRLNVGTEITYNSFDESFGHKPFAKVKIINLGNLNQATRQYKIISVGTINNHSRTVEKTFQVIWLPKDSVNFPTNTAVYVDTTIDLSGGASIIGTVGTNSSATKSISLDGGSSISGDIYVGPNAENNVISKPDYIQVRNPIKMMTTRSLELPSFPTFPSPSIPSNVKVDNNSNSYDVILNGALRIDNWVSDNYTLNMNQDMSFTDIKIESNYTLNINIGNANRSLVVNNLNVPNGKINIIGSGKLTVYINGTITMGSGSIINSGGNINQLDMYLKGSGNPSSPKKLDLSGAQKIYASLYAKDATISLTGGSGFQGQILTGGRNVTINGGANAITQLFFAPNANITVAGGGSITGIIIAKSVTASGGSTITFKQPSIDQLPFFPNNGAGGEVTIDNLIVAGGTREVQ